MILKKWEDLPTEMQTDEVRKYYDILQKKKGSLIFKRCCDIVLSSVMLVGLFPVFLLFLLSFLS